MFWKCYLFNDTFNILIVLLPLEIWSEESQWWLTGVDLTLTLYQTGVIDMANTIASIHTGTVVIIIIILLVLNDKYDTLGAEYNYEKKLQVCRLDWTETEKASVTGWVLSTHSFIHLLMFILYYLFIL